MICALSEHQDVQAILHAEILKAQALYGEDIPHDNLVAPPYMDAFCRECLRL